jgi:hypothetical protein
VFELIASLGSAALQYGALGFGWVLAVILLAYFIRSLKARDKELMQVKTQHINDVKLWGSKLEQLHEKQSKIVSDLTDKRVEDLKELVDDYNEIATSMVTSLDKLASSIKSKKQD